ncbi:quinone oxidoreductase [Sphingomonas sp. So64.6b]|uniref:quinone oxidoreductase family protein n=1 Tax=Sphingomonas sp. So64.6b TaxID=2997354 RepID=UPI0015FED0F4|nr:quinone oxidoreductase [Sphingomonas sp. So64.6b]QNA86365.1 quinone oxidoreductase [Sphingomonas sp. So64.6b]
MNICVQATKPGDSSVLEVVNREPGSPGPEEVLLRQEAIGVNFVDIYHRTGIYPLPGWPSTLGVEGAGIVKAIGSEVTNIRVGDRIVYGGVLGGYASKRIIPASRAVRLPDKVSSEVAAASMLRAMTVHMLTAVVHKVDSGQTILVHAAAGGLGGLLVQWIKTLGATVIATVGSSEKAEIARLHGADHVIVGRDADYAAEVEALTGGTFVDYAIDGIGGATLLKTLGCVKPFGIVASIGQAAGPIPPVSVVEIGRRSLSLARPSIMGYLGLKGGYDAAAQAAIAMMAAGIAADVGARYSLTDAAQAQDVLERGDTTGSVLLLP